MLESFRLHLSKSLLVFLDIGDEAHLARVRTSMIDAGGSSSTSRTVVFSLSSGIELEGIREIVGTLDEGDCVSVVFEEGGAAKSVFIVPPRITAEGVISV